jgi:hypothetical protein
MIKAQLWMITVPVPSGRFDHMVDYRESIALAQTRPFGASLIVRDIPGLDGMKASGLYRVVRKLL